MAKRKKIITTTNREIYEKFNMLNFSKEVLLKNVKNIRVEKIIKSINKNGTILDLEKVGDYLLVKKVAPVNFEIYFR